MSIPANGSLCIYERQDDNTHLSTPILPEGKQIRPCPLVSLTCSPIKNGMGQLGANYNISLRGTVPYNKFYIDSTARDYNLQTPQDNPLKQNRTKYFLEKQKELINIFSAPFLLLEFQEPDTGLPIWKAYCKLENISFDEGTYFSKMDYNISLTTNEIYDFNWNLFESSKTKLMQGFGNFPQVSGIQDFNETWNFEIDESTGYMVDGNFNGGATEYLCPRTYILTRNLSCTGSTNANRAYSENRSDRFPKPSWQQAREYVQEYAKLNDYAYYLNSGTYFFNMGLPQNRSPGSPSSTQYMGYNHSRTESLDKGAGTFSITDRWLIAPTGLSAIESFNSSIESSLDNSYVKISIDGSIKGLSTWAASGDYVTPSSKQRAEESPFAKAQAHFHKITNNGNFGQISRIYKRAAALLNPVLNPIPLSVSVGTNPITGEITYNIAYDNRPHNFFTNVVSENINVSDTYPGDIFSIVPVIGRPTGPVLQASFGRTEYKRDISIELVLDYTDLATNLGFREDPRRNLLLRKPSLNTTLQQELRNLISSLSPAQEPGIRKYFLSPPTETWNPKDGRYTLNLGWTYELSE